METLCQQFCIENPRQVIRAFREFRENNGAFVPDELKGLLAAINTVPISSAECERGFSQMNLICTANRSALLPSTISTLLFLCLVGPPLTRFNPIPYVKSWITQGHRSARDQRSRERCREKESPGSMDAVWAVLNNWDVSKMNFIILCCAGAVCVNMLAYLCLCVDAHVCVYLCFVQLCYNRPRGWTGVTRATQLSDVGLNLLRRRGATKANNGLYYYSVFLWSGPPKWQMLSASFQEPCQGVILMMNGMLLSVLRCLEVA